MIGGDLITYRPDIQVLDATIRDGGLVNDFYFTDEFIRALYEANIKAGVDYMEFGYKASKEMFDVNKFGKWKFCNEEDIRAIVGENNTDLKISVMADVGGYHRQSRQCYRSGEGGDIHQHHACSHRDD